MVRLNKQRRRIREVAVLSEPPWIGMSMRGDDWKILRNFIELMGNRAGGGICRKQPQRIQHAKHLKLSTAKNDNQQ
jgi:hypothetical protein